jgi:hypothetical protein
MERSLYFEVAMRRLSILLAVVAIIGCGSDKTTTAPTLAPTDSAVAGTYSLVTANGLSLPFFAFITSDTDEEYDMTADKFIIANDNTWSDSTTYFVTSLITGATRTTISGATGTYALSASQINFTISDGTVFPGSVTGNTLSVLFSGGQFIYSR